MANYHPTDELLMAFSAGQLPNALGLMLACHIEHCPDCQRKMHQFNELGGNILDSLEPLALDEGAIGKLLERLDDPEPVVEKVESLPGIPRPLQRFIPAHYDNLAWQGMSSSLKEFTLEIDDDRYTTKLFRIAAGKQLPEHTHKGNEFTLVMKGSFSDKSCNYHAGDFVLADTSTRHQPQAANDGDCICLAVMDAPLKLTGTFGRMLNPFMR
jgi:putative transcriptional regulator